jgi:curved DNA-binding protein CbpA
MIEGAGRAGIMTPDYYAILGVSPASEDVVIRAAYLALMRRYHPDRNASAEAAERARAITAAYAVLSDGDRRAEYDWVRAQQRGSAAPGTAAGGWRRPRPTALFAVAAMMVLLLVVAISTRLPVREPPKPGPDRQRSQTEASRSNAAADPVPDGLVRPFADVSEAAIPVAIAPPIEEPAPPVIILDDEPQPRPQLAKAPPRPTLPPSPRTPALTQASATATPKAAAAKPSFSCRYAKGRGEVAVCGDAGLASLDRHLAMLYGQSWGRADAAKRAALLRTRDGFLSSREACRSESCIRTVYLGRMREVSDIMTTK